MAIFNPDGSVEGLEKTEKILGKRVGDISLEETQRQHVIDGLGRRLKTPVDDHAPGQWGGTMRKPGGVGYR